MDNPKWGSAEYSEPLLFSAPSDDATGWSMGPTLSFNLSYQPVISLPQQVTFLTDGRSPLDHALHVDGNLCSVMVTIAGHLGLAVLRQSRFPVSRKKRIRRKWAKRWENWGLVECLYRGVEQQDEAKDF